MAAPKLRTVDEYLRTPETVAPAELRFGVLRVAESPTPRHQSAVARIFRALDGYVGTRIGKTEERITWFAEYGVRECWLVHLDRREVTVITYANRRIATRALFGRRHSISSSVFPDFTESFDEMVGPERRQ